MNSSGLHPTKLAEAKVEIEPLKLPENIAAFEELMKLAGSCFGPKSQLKCIQISEESSAIVTSTSRRLFQYLPVSNPYLKLIIQAVKEHLKIYKDSGTFLTYVTLNILTKFTNLPFPPQLISSLFDAFSIICLEYLKSETCHPKVQLDFDSVKQLMSVTQYIISSKPGCSLQGDESTHLTLQLVKCFLHTIPSPAVERPSQPLRIGRLHFTTYEGGSVSDSVMYPGLLLSSKLCSPRTLKCRERLQVILFTVSLAWNEENPLPPNHFEFCSTLELQSYLSTWFEMFGRKLLDKGIGMVACQKIVNVDLKKYLEDHGVIVLEKLGLETASALKELCGAIPLGNLVVPPDNRPLGFLEKLDVVTLNNRSYLNIQNRRSSVTTLLLCNWSEESLEEMKVVCQQAVSVLYQLLLKPVGLYGAGCTECHVASVLRKQVQKDLHIYTKRFGCSEAVVLSTCECFSSCLENSAVSLSKTSRLNLKTDSRFHHLWYESPGGDLASSCACGQFNKSDLEPCIWHSLRRGEMDFVYEEDEPDTVLKNSQFNVKLSAIIDGCASRLNAYHVAMETCSALLRTVLYIEDRN